jgi:hypothetical protein
MATLEASFLQGQLEERKRRLEVAVASAPRNSGLAGLLREVDSALDALTDMQVRGGFELSAGCRLQMNTHSSNQSTRMGPMSCS